MRLLFPALALLLVLGAAPARAQSDAQHMLDAIFQLFDEDRDGVITTAEANRAVDRSFAEMDTKKAGRIGPEAWMRFSFGLADLAADQGLARRVSAAAVGRVSSRRHRNLPARESTLSGAGTHTFMPSRCLPAAFARPKVPYRSR
jgi:hypothetical protein